MARTRILLAEDDQNHQYLLCRAIRAHSSDVEIEVVETRSEFFSRIANSTFDCVIIDYNLKDCQAPDLIGRFRHMQPTCPVIVISSHSNQEIVIRSVREGCMDFVQKDEAVNSSILWDRIDTAIRRQLHEGVERRKMERRICRLQSLAETDPLTGLNNRRGLGRLLKRSRRGVFDRRGNLSIAMLDLDWFKRINDDFGHDCGDRVIKSVADTIRASLSPKDFACRWGGEEILIVRPGYDLASGLRWADQLRTQIERIELIAKERRVSITASVGISAAPAREFSLEAIERTDKALYLAKRMGRNRVCTWEMVQFENAAHSSNAKTPEERLSQTLELSRKHLGPTQWNHLTDHSQEVGRVAQTLRRGMQLAPECHHQLGLAGLFHDIGKYVIPEAVLAKPTKLSPDESALVGRHAAIGAQMSAQLGVDDYVSHCVYHHHDFCETDTNGCRVEPGAKLLSVADALVAMTSDRPYQPAKTKANALAELRRMRGIQFDPDAVDAATATFV